MTADLYIRVSTDEQADKGYSQRDQEERLRKYCELQKITIRKVIREDHSAKTFNRPEWTKLLADLKKRRGQVDSVLFTKWDRFSRNAGDAYQMIGTLRKLEVEPQAIEQPLDLSVPENKMMLAFYLAAPEVENDRRALNVLHGMRRAKKEGRWMGVAPVGYANKITEDGKKYIAPKEPEAGIMQWVFKSLVTGQYTVEQIFKEAQLKGIKVARSNFWVSLRNPVYCGKIPIVTLWRTKRPGMPLAFISRSSPEALFYDVQDYLDRQKKNFRTKLEFPGYFAVAWIFALPQMWEAFDRQRFQRQWRSVLLLSLQQVLRGSLQRPENANDLFCRELRKYIPRPGMEQAYARVLNTAYKVRTKKASGKI